MQSWSPDVQHATPGSRTPQLKRQMFCYDVASSRHSSVGETSSDRRRFRVTSSVYSYRAFSREKDNKMLGEPALEAGWGPVPHFPMVLGAPLDAPVTHCTHGT